MASKPKVFWKRHLALLIVFGAALIFTIVSGLIHWRINAHADVRISFLDVGQGDSALIRDRQGKDVLIDGGPDDAVLEGLANAMPWWDRTIDTIIVTHLDADHYIGFFGVLNRYKVNEVWWSGVAPTTDTARRLIALVEDKGITQRFVRAGDHLNFENGTEFRVLWPKDGMHGRLVSPTSSNAKGGGTNDFGVVGMFDCGQDQALFTADISAHVEAAMIAAGVPLQAAILKVPHHGSAYSSSETFLDAVHPRDAVISVGASNRYGHPTPRVLAALLERGIRIHRTDREGTITYACTDGKLVR